MSGCENNSAEREEEEDCLLHLSESQRMFPGANHGKQPRFLCTKATEVTLI